MPNPTEKRRNQDLNAAYNPSIHAIGTVALEWNVAENTLDSIIWLYLGTDVPTAKLVTRPLGNKGKVSLLKQLVELKEPDKELSDAVSHAINCFELCLANRNHLIHSRIAGYSDSDGISLTKYRKANPTQDHRLTIKTDYLRDCANEIYYTHSYIKELTAVISLLLTQRALEPDPFEDSSPAKAPPLPEKPKPPRNLAPLLQLDQTEDDTPP